MCQLICYPAKKLVVHVVEAYVKSSSIAHTTLLLLSLSVWCCCSSPVPHLAASQTHRMLVDVFNLLSFMINSCVTIVRSYIKGLWEMLLFHYIVCCVCGGTVISVGAVCGRCLGLNWLLPESVGELQKNN